MKCKSILVVLICVELVVVSGKPPPPQQQQGPQVLGGNEKFQDTKKKEAVGAGGPTEIGLRHSHSFQAGKISGKPVSGWAYLEASLGKSDSQYEVDGTSFLPRSLWSGRMVDIATAGLYSAAVMTILGTAYYIGVARTGGGGAVKSAPAVKPLSTKEQQKPFKTEVGGGGGDQGKVVGSAGGGGNQGKVVGPAGAGETKKVSRRRREVVRTYPEADADLTLLASTVLNAIASGECLQKTICQVGSQIGRSKKGRLGFSLLDTLLPKSLHSNTYFVTMKKALTGESTCDKFNCSYAY